MKNLNLVLNIVLLAAVSVLFYLHFSGREATPVAESAPAIPVKPSMIAYLNSDTLLSNYAFLKAKKEALEARHNKITSELESEGARLQGDAGAYQQRGAMMTPDERRKVEEELMMREQQLIKKQKTMMATLDEESQKINDELYKNLTEYLKDYNKNKHYEFILDYQRGGSVLLANDSLDITKQILDGLNKKYTESLSPSK